MPNWTSVTLSARGPQTAIAEYSSWLEQLFRHDPENPDRACSVAQAIMPIPAELLEEGNVNRTQPDPRPEAVVAELERLYGESNGYDWTTSNWGVKWGDTDTMWSVAGNGDARCRYRSAPPYQVEVDSDHVEVLHYQVPWDHGGGFVEAISERFPRVEFWLDAWFEGGEGRLRLVFVAGDVVHALQDDTGYPPEVGMECSGHLADSISQLDIEEDFSGNTYDLVLAAIPEVAPEVLAYLVGLDGLEPWYSADAVSDHGVTTFPEAEALFNGDPISDDTWAAVQVACVDGHVPNRRRTSSAAANEWVTLVALRHPDVDMELIDNHADWACAYVVEAVGTEEARVRAQGIDVSQGALSFTALLHDDYRSTVAELEARVEADEWASYLRKVVQPNWEGGRMSLLRTVLRLKRAKI